MLNRATLIGNLGADPELRYTANGKALTTFSIAVGGKDKTEWFRIVAWEGLAERCSQHLLKGRKVYVEGRLTTRTYDGTDGKKRYITEIVASNVEYLDKAPREDDGMGWADPEPMDFDDVPFS